jgi:choline kinase
MQSLLKILKDFVNFLMINEKKENQAIKEYLNFSFKIADAYTNLEWADTDEQNIAEEVSDRQYQAHGKR